MRVHGVVQAAIHVAAHEQAIALALVLLELEALGDAVLLFGRLALLRLLIYVIT